MHGSGRRSALGALLRRRQLRSNRGRRPQAPRAGGNRRRRCCARATRRTGRGTRVRIGCSFHCRRLRRRHPLRAALLRRQLRANRARRRRALRANRRRRRPSRGAGAPSRSALGAQASSLQALLVHAKLSDEALVRLHLCGKHARTPSERGRARDGGRISTSARARLRLRARVLDEQ